MSLALSVDACTVRGEVHSALAQGMAQIAALLAITLNLFPLALAWVPLPHDPHESALAPFSFDWASVNPRGSWSTTTLLDLLSAPGSWSPGLAGSGGIKIQRDCRHCHHQAAGHGSHRGLYIS